MLSTMIYSYSWAEKLSKDAYARLQILQSWVTAYRSPRSKPDLEAANLEDNRDLISLVRVIRRKTVRIAGLKVAIWTQDLDNMKQEY
jgi:hypothetical protein